MLPKEGKSIFARPTRKIIKTENLLTNAIYQFNIEGLLNLIMAGIIP